MPQQVSLIDVEKSIDFSRKVNIPIVGIIENMSGSVFGKGTVKGFAKSLNVDFLGSLELNEKIRISGDEGKPFVIQDSDSKRSFEPIVKKIIGFCERKK
jgi:ATP-binding protein involved in chromosome partitioning